MIQLYLDPRHDRSLRLVYVNENGIIVHGFMDGDDEAREPWIVRGSTVFCNAYEEQFRVDFSTKKKHHGERYLTCTVGADMNILWSDGNVWLCLQTNIEDNGLSAKETFRRLTKLL